MNDNPIGIFDSGIGGISILNEIRKVLPNEKYIYFGDSLNNPYGDKTKEELMDIVCDIVEWFIEKECKLIVIACNTATTLLIKDLRDKYPDTIFVGTEPAIKVAYDYYYDKNVLVMATPGTIKSEKVLELSNKYYQENRYLLQCDQLANLIENKSKSINSYLEELLADYKSKNIEVVVLGCTHYPFIKDKISNILEGVTFIDGSRGIANRVYTILNKQGWVSNRKSGDVLMYNSIKSKLNIMKDLLD